MPRLTDVCPDAEALLALEPAELATFVLEVARSYRSNGVVHLQALFSGIFKNDSLSLNNPKAYPSTLGAQIELAVAEAWSWLQANQLLVPDPGPNGYYGHMRLSRRAEAIKSSSDAASAY